MNKATISVNPRRGTFIHNGEPSPSFFAGKIQQKMAEYYQQEQLSHQFYSTITQTKFTQRN